MQLKPDATPAEKVETVRLFVNELRAFADNWEVNGLQDNNKEYIEEYLAGDLVRFERIIREEMVRRGAAIV